MRRRARVRNHMSHMCRASRSARPIPYHIIRIVLVIVVDIVVAQVTAPSLVICRVLVTACILARPIFIVISDRITIIIIRIRHRVRRNGSMRIMNGKVRNIHYAICRISVAMC